MYILNNFEELLHIF